ncbi:MAG TPA: DUF192 domain-containing protein [Planctomycetota bacterium]|nr:DUF192 domain-containing protein [Planctomycetota bacterium]
MRRWILPALAIGLVALIVLPFVLGAGGSSVEIKGTTFAVEHLLGDDREPSRRSPVARRATLPADQAILCSWDHDRHLYFFSDEATGVFDVAFLDAGGKVLDVRRLRTHRGDFREDAGVSSKFEARRALFLPEGAADKLALVAGDAVRLSGDLASATPDPMPVIKIGRHEVRVEISSTGWLRNRGLMHRPKLTKDEGMLFIYPKPEPSLSFYMRNTLMALDIAFFNEMGRLVSVHPTQPAEDPATMGAGIMAKAGGLAQFVLEVPYGWFREHGLTDDHDRPLKEVILEMPDKIKRAVSSAESH